MSDQHERYARAAFFQSDNVIKHIYNWQVMPQWVDAYCFWYRLYTRRGYEFIFVDLGIPERRHAFDHERLAGTLSDALGEVVAPYALPFEAIRFAADQQTIMFDIGEARWTYTQANGLLVTSAKPLADDALVSPDGRRAVYGEAHNLWLHDISSDTREPLTTDGIEYHAYGVEQGGTMTSLSDALTEKRIRPSAIWSPDSRYLLTVRVDERAVKDMHLLQSVPDAGLRPHIHTYKLAMPGDEHFPILTYWLFDVEKGRAYPTKMPPQVGTGESVFYWAQFGMTIARLWSMDSQRLYIHVQTADQRRLELYEIEAATGVARCVMSESGETPLYFNQFRFNNPNYRVLDDTQELIWYSEESGWGQLYLYDLVTGALKNRISGGVGVIRDVLYVDEVERWVYFTAGGIEAGRNPYYRHLYRARLDGSVQELLTPEDAEHLVSASPDGRFFVDSYGQLDSSLKTLVRDARGRIVLMLEESDDADLRARGWRPQEAFCAKGRDGQTDIYGALYTPTDFDPTCRYPVIDMIYGGSQLTITPHLFPLVTGSPYIPSNIEILLEDFWAPQAMAELGFVVVVMDGMGTPYRERWFHEAAVRESGNAGGAEDHLCAIQQLAAERPYMDAFRVGICGHSGGGDNSLKAMLRFPDFFKVAVSSAGSHNMAAYQAGAGLSDIGHEITDFERMTNEALAHRLQGKLLLVYGDMDENCHPLHTLRVVDALIKADKHFDLLVMPNRNHGFTTDPYFVRRRWDYFVQHLLS
ncbi:MAG: DPP IV N-terminal domain-containing protein [Chloroflexota bacterium]|nr:DPP IV N-terminal domain-containing protein [Chloroflexota bacterium]